MRKSNKGFTLLEVLIVVVIAVSVAAFGVPAYKKSQERNRYLAAQGVLMDLGNAVRTFRQDLKIDCISNKVDVKTFPDSTAAVQLRSNWQTTTQEGDLSSLTTNADMGAAMFTRKYLAPIQFPTGTHVYKGYSFYICPQTTSSSSYCCGGDSTVVACTRNTSSTNYQWARYHKDGSITQSN